MSARTDRVLFVLADALVGLAFWADRKRKWARITDDAPRVP